MKKAASIREVSRLAGVSVATVSRIINQKGRYAAETEARVHEVMRQLDYVPNKIAQTMRTGLTRSIGIMVPDILNEQYALTIRVAQADLLERGYITMVFNTTNDPAIAAQCVEVMRSQRVSGIICFPDSALTSLDVKDIPLVYMDREPADGLREGESIIEADDMRAGQLAAEALLNMGCSRIGVMMDIQPLSSHRKRLEGFCTALNAVGHTLADKDILRVDSRKTSQAITLLHEIHASDVLPDGLFTMESRLTLGALSLNVRERLNLKIVGYGPMRMLDYGLCPVCTVRPPIEDMAHRAAQLIIERIEGITEHPQHLVYDVTLRIV